MSTATELERPAEKQTAMVEVAKSREAQEVMAAMLVAQKCPRNEEAALDRILTACQRKSLAEQAVYAYPRGGTQVTGPSIRLAEAMAQNWGNVSCGLKELEQRNGESTVMAYAWDMETNFRQEKVFTVKHERHTKAGVTKLTDPRDIYELVANQGARRLRSCIVGVIPGDIVEAAVDQCEKTMTKDVKVEEGVKKVIAAFEPLGVTKAMIEKRVGCKIEAIVVGQLVQLRKIYKSLTDGMAQVADFFDAGNGELPLGRGKVE